MDGRRAAGEPVYSLDRQRTVQTACCALTLVLSVVQLCLTYRFDLAASPAWECGALVVAGLTALSSFLGLAGVRSDVYGLLLLHLTLLVCVFMPFRVLFSCLGFPARGRWRGFWCVEVAGSALLVLLSWFQAYTGTVALGLLRVQRAFRAHDALHEGTGEIPTEELLALLADLGAEPSMSQAVEMLSLLPDGRRAFNFDEFCAMYSTFQRSRRRKRRRKGSAEERPARRTAETESPMAWQASADAEEPLLPARGYDGSGAAAEGGV